MGRVACPLCAWRDMIRLVTELLLWAGLGSWRAEVAEADLDGDRLAASGTQLGVDPLPYRLDYTLRTGPRFVTERLDVVSRGQGWRRHLDLRHDGAGTWTCTVDQDGADALPAAGGDLAPVAGALDCDLGRSPLTNLMPVRRHELHRRPGDVDFLMAWVSVPDLGVHPAQQRYEYLRASPDGGAVVRYVGAQRGFVGELILDARGFVLTYPDLAERIPAEGRRPRSAASTT
jgi:hypothetical protein